MPGLGEEGVVAMNMLGSRVLLQDSTMSSGDADNKQGLVFIVSDDPESIVNVAPVCDFLDLEVRVVSGGNDLETMLRAQRPMAVIADLDGAEQDGFHAMKVISRFDRDLPILLMTHGDPTMMGAADAVQEVWGLGAVTLTKACPPAGQIVSFLFTAGRRAGCMRLVPV